MAEITNILLESGTNELEMVEFYWTRRLGPGTPCWRASRRRPWARTRPPAIAAITA